MTRTTAGPCPGERLRQRDTFCNRIGRSNEEIVQARQDWMQGTRFG
ncbi:hypothetical protein [Streptomyces goshikiensis]